MVTSLAMETPYLNFLVIGCGVIVPTGLVNLMVSQSDEASERSDRSLEETIKKQNRGNNPQNARSAVVASGNPHRAHKQQFPVLKLPQAGHLSVSDWYFLCKWHLVFYKAKLYMFSASDSIQKLYMLYKRLLQNCTTVQATSEDRLTPTINSSVNSKRSQIPNSLLFGAADHEHLFILGSIDETPQLRQVGYCNQVSS